MAKRKVKAPTMLRIRTMRRAMRMKKLPEVNEDDQAEPFVEPHLQIGL